MKNKSRYFLAELLGSCSLVMIIVGSGLMAENLTNDVAVMLIANKEDKNIAAIICFFIIKKPSSFRVFSYLCYIV